MQVRQEVRYQNSSRESVDTSCSALSPPAPANLYHAGVFLTLVAPLRAEGPGLLEPQGDAWGRVPPNPPQRPVPPPRLWPGVPVCAWPFSPLGKRNSIQRCVGYKSGSLPHQGPCVQGPTKLGGHHSTGATLVRGGGYLGGLDLTPRGKAASIAGQELRALPARPGTPRSPPPPFNLLRARGEMGGPEQGHEFWRPAPAK